jgi:cytochrome bd-type quinol oxidase subunit 1
MRTLLKVLLMFFGLGLQMLALFFLLDGFLGLRSKRPGLSIFEVSLGLVFFAVGWYIRRVGRRVTLQPPELK